MIEEKYIKALSIIDEKLLSIKWVLIGSTNLALHGIDVDLKDIDIIVNNNDSLKADDLLREYKAIPV